MVDGVWWMRWMVVNGVWWYAMERCMCVLEEAKRKGEEEKREGEGEVRRERRKDGGVGECGEGAGR